MPDPVQYAQEVAEAYAEALLPLAREAGLLEDTLAELEQVAALAAEVRLVDWVESPLVPLARKAAVMEKAFRGNVSDLTCDVLGVMTLRGRIGQLKWIVAAFRTKALAAMNKLEVTVTTATPLDDAARAKVVEALRSRLGAEPVLDEHVDEDILGGLVVQRGDEVIDMSVEGELEQIKWTIARWLDRMQASKEPGPGWEAETDRAADGSPDRDNGME